MAGLTKVMTTEKSVNKKQLGAFQAAIAAAKKGGIETKVLAAWRKRLELPETATTNDIVVKLGGTVEQKPVKVKKVKAPVSKIIGMTEECVILLKEKNKTDEDMASILKDKPAFSGKPMQFILSKISRIRSLLRIDGATKFKTMEIERLYQVDGKLIPKSQMPKTDRVRKPKYTPENDPLAKVAGIIVKPKETKSAAEPSGKK